MKESMREENGINKTKTEVEDRNACMTAKVREQGRNEKMANGWREE